MLRFLFRVKTTSFGQRGRNSTLYLRVLLKQGIRQCQIVKNSATIFRANHLVGFLNFNMLVQTVDFPY